MKFLTVIQFESLAPAHTTFQKITSLHAKDPKSVHDAVLVEHQDSIDRIKIKQTTDVPAAAAVGGGFWGLLIGAIFLMPVAGLAVGALAGAAAGTASDFGLDDTFLKQVGQTLTPGSAAILILSPQPLSSDYQATFQDLPHQLLETEFTPEHQQKLHQALDQ